MSFGGTLRSRDLRRNRDRCTLAGAIMAAESNSSFAEQVALSRIARVAAAASFVRIEQRRGRCEHRRGAGDLFSNRADPAIRELDAYPVPRTHSCGGAERATLRIAHKSKSARQYVPIGESAQQLAGLFHPRVLIPQKPKQATSRPLGKSGYAFALPRVTDPIGVGIGPHAGCQT